jgi:hypothetical protein
MEFAGGATSLNLTPADVSSTHTVSLFADLTGGGGGGVFFVSASVNFSSTLTPLRCAEEPFGQFGVGGVTAWGPLTPGCGPPPGGISGQNVSLIEQGVSGGTNGGTFGKLKLGTVTFHVAGTGTDTITPFYTALVDGFLQNDGTTFTSTAPVFGAVVNIVPEPTTAVGAAGEASPRFGPSGPRPRRKPRRAPLRWGTVVWGREETSRGCVGLAPRLQRQAQVVLRFQVVGLDLQRPTVVADRLVDLAPKPKRIAESVVRLRPVRLQLHRLTVVDDRLVEPPLQVQGETQLAVCFPVAGMG